MLDKNKEKQRRKERREKTGKNWNGLYPRLTPTKVEKQKRDANKYRQKDFDED